MHVENKKLNDKDIRLNTLYGKRRLERTARQILSWLQEVTGDRELEKKRHEALLCPACHYLDGNRIVCHVITTAECGKCGREMTFMNSGTDRLCKDCGYALGLCVRCGSDLDLKERKEE